MKTLTKYPDRRLYDKEQKCFTNLQSLISFIRSGEMVQVLCSRSGEDCTDSVLLSAFMSLPESKEMLKGPLLYRLIRSTGPGVYNRRLAERISISLERLKTELDDLDSFYGQLNSELKGVRDNSDS